MRERGVATSNWRRGTRIAKCHVSAHESVHEGAHESVHWSVNESAHESMHGRESVALVRGRLRVVRFTRAGESSRAPAPQGERLQRDEDRAEQFKRDGFVILDRILDAEAVAIARRSLDRILAGQYHGDRRPPALQASPHPIFGDAHTTHWVVNGRLLDADLWSLVTRAELGRAAARLLETRAVSVIEDQLLDKPPGGAPLATHQDYRYWQFSTSPRMLTCWIALDDMSPEIGTVQVVPGSHRWGHQVVERNLAEDFRASVDGATSYLQVAEALRPPDAEIQLTPVIVPTGGGVLFHSLTIHSSGRNTTDRRRRALSIHYASAECRIIPVKTYDQAFPYCFARLKEGDRLVNKYLPEVYSADPPSTRVDS